MGRQAALIVATLWLSAAQVLAAGPHGGDAAVVREPADVENASPQPVDSAVDHDGGATDQPAVQTLGNGDQKVYLVDHGGTWSMHVENVVTGELVRLWQEAGGPQVVAKTPLDRPYTLSVHKLAPERIFERLLDGFDYTLHYNSNGRLERVRVYSIDPAASSTFKTPRLVEGLGKWREVETAGPSAPASPAGEATATPAAAQSAPPAVPASPSNP